MIITSVLSLVLVALVTLLKQTSVLCSDSAIPASLQALRGLDGPSSHVPNKLSEEVEENRTTLTLSATATVSTAPSSLKGLPAPPTNVQANAGDKSVVVGWKAPTEDGGYPILSYTVLGFMDNINGTQEDREATSLTVSGGTGTTSAVVGGLVNGVRYYFKVFATNQVGNSIASAPSKPVTPIRPTNMCLFVGCSNQGLCVPDYEDDQAVCICKPGYSLSPDCSTARTTPYYFWKPTEWELCDAGCNGGYQRRKVKCMKFINNEIAEEKEASRCEEFEPRPSEGLSCHLMQCGTTIARVIYPIQLQYEDVTFDARVRERFVTAFITELANALQVHKERLSVARLSEGLRVHFDILPVMSAKEKTVDQIVEDLQEQVKTPTSALRTTGTFCPLVAADKVTISVERALEKSVDMENPAARLSFPAVMGTLIIIIGLIWVFAIYLRRRHESLMSQKGSRYVRMKVETS